MCLTCSLKGARAWWTLRAETSVDTGTPPPPRQPPPCCCTQGPGHRCHHHHHHHHPNLIIIIIYTLTWSAHLHPLLSLSYARPGGHWYLEVSTIAIKCQQVISKLSTKVKFINWLVSNWLQVSNRLINKFCRNINQQVCWNYLLTCVNRCQQYG